MRFDGAQTIGGNHSVGYITSDSGSPQPAKSTSSKFGAGGIFEDMKKLGKVVYQAVTDAMTNGTQSTESGATCSFTS